MKLWKLVSLVVLPLALAACRDQAPAAQSTDPVLVKSMQIVDALSTKPRSFPGRVRANKEVTLSFEVAGKLVKLPVLEGAEMKKGELVAEIDPERYQSRLDDAQAKYKFEKAQLGRMKTLVEKGYVSYSDYDRRQSTYAAAKADLEQKQRDLSDTRLLAPFEGMVTKRDVDNYQYVQAKQSIVNFKDVTQVDVLADIPESIIVNVKRDEDRKIYVEFESVPNRKFTVDLKEFSAEADPETHTYRVVVTMPAPKDLNILPGMTAQLVLPVDVVQAGVSQYYLIPSAAVFMSQDNQASVWLIDPKTSMVKRQTVKTGNLSGANIQILSGLKSGDRIVRAGVHFLQAGQKVVLSKKPNS